jgi:hypothetical protein
MKKLKATIFFLIFFASVSFSQDTIFYQDFEIDDIGFMIFDFPSGIAGDTNYYNTDEDGLDDASTLGNRPSQWFLTNGFANADSSNTVLGANSWTDDPVNPVKNWLILPLVQITDTSAKLSWKSAPFQTPYYLDGYKVLVSTTTNDLSAFTDTLFVAAEYIDGPFDDHLNCCDNGDYSLYTFSEGFVHGQDSLYIAFNDEGDGITGTYTAGDSARNQALLRPWTVGLSQYDGQQIYIAFLHDSHDDNLISIDDILITEFTDPMFSVEDQNDGIVGTVYPNPAHDFVNVTFDAGRYHNVRVDISDNRGMLVFSKLTNEKLQVPVTGLAAGLYYVKVTADEGSMVKKLIITH